MNFVQKFLGKFDDYDEMAANAIAKEFQDKPECLMELFSYFRNIEGYVPLLMNKIIAYNTGIVDSFVEVTSDDKLDQILKLLDDSILDSSNVDRILNKTKGNKKTIVKTVRAVVDSRPDYPIEPTIEESMDKFIDDRDIVFDLLSSIPRERQTKRMIVLSINGYGEYAFNFIDTNHLGEYQKKYRETLDIINRWSEHPETQTPLGFAKTIDRINSQEIVYPRVYDDLLAGTKSQVINEKNARLFFNSKYKRKSRAEVSRMVNKYSYLLANNEHINEWIDLDLMLADNDIPQEAILELSRREVDSTDEFKPLLQALGDEESISEGDIRSVAKIMTSPHNYFDVYSMDDVRNYESKKKEVCMDILYGNEMQKQMSREALARRYRISKKNLNKFAILQNLYGTDYESAEGLIDRFGRNIDGVKAITEEDQKYIGYLKGINSIITLDEQQADRAIQDIGFKDLLQKCDSSKMPNKAVAEDKYKELYSRMYQDSIFDPGSKKIGRENSAIREADSLIHGKNVIKVLEIKPSPEKPLDFSMIVGADETHESYINQSMLAVTKDSTRPVLGYSKFDTVEFESDFDSPERTISNTRAGANRIRAKKKRTNLKEPAIKPSYIVWFKEKSSDDFGRLETQNFFNLSGRDSDRLMDEKVRYDNSKHIAATLGLPIVIVDREAIAVQETSKLNNRLLGMSKPDDIKDTITLFENNRNGMEDSEYLRTNFFTDDDRKGMVKSIFRFIDEKIDGNKKKKKAYALFRDVLLEEKAKTNLVPVVYDEAIEILDSILEPQESKQDIVNVDNIQDL